MRTSYNRSGTGNKPVEKHVETVRKSNEVNNHPSRIISEPPEVDEIHSMIVTGCSSAKDALETRMSQGTSTTKQEQPVQGQKPQKEDTAKKHNDKKAKKGKLPNVLLSTVAVSGAFVAGLFLSRVEPIQNIINPIEPTEPFTSNISDITKNIDLLYKDSSKASLADGFNSDSLEGIRTDLKEETEHGVGTSRWDDELDTIANFVKDGQSMDKYEVLEYSLSQDGLEENLLKVKSSANEYSVDGLKNSMYARVDALLAELNEFNRIKTELEGITDPKSVDLSAYPESIKVIKHTTSQSYLTCLLNKAVADKDVLTAEDALKALEEKEEDTEKAQEAVSEAKKKQAEAISALEDIEAKIKYQEKTESSNENNTDESTTAESSNSSEPSGSKE